MSEAIKQVDYGMVIRQLHADFGAMYRATKRDWHAIGVKFQMDRGRRWTSVAHFPRWSPHLAQKRLQVTVGFYYSPGWTRKPEGTKPVAMATVQVIDDGVRIAYLAVGRRDWHLLLEYLSSNLLCRYGLHYRLGSPQQVDRPALLVRSVGGGLVSVGDWE